MFTSAFQGSACCKTAGFQLRQDKEVPNEGNMCSNSGIHKSNADRGGFALVVQAPEACLLSIGPLRRHDDPMLRGFGEPNHVGSPRMGKAFFPSCFVRGSRRVFATSLASED
jgi:hypothetical protein